MNFNTKNFKYHNLKDLSLNRDLIDYGGIYFLYLDNVIVYIGMSTTSIKDRVYGSFGKKGHIDTKIFDSVKCFEIDNAYDYKHKILNKELELIRKYQPYFNIIGIPETEDKKCGKEKEVINKIENFRLQNSIRTAERCWEFFNL